MINASDIKKDMEVRGVSGAHVGTVDGVEGDRIKLTRKDSADGVHHYVPLSEVARVDEHVHLSTAGPAIGATGAGATGAAGGLGHGIANPAVAGATPRTNYYLPWVLLALGILALLFALSRCDRDEPVATVDPAANPAVIDPIVAATPTAGVSGLGTYLAGSEAAPRTFTFEKLNFDTGKSEVRSQDQEELAAIATSLKQYGAVRVNVVGFADARGAAGANADLGQARAAAVKAALVAQGIGADRIETASGGEANPVATNESAPGQAENRRTELVVVAR